MNDTVQVPKKDIKIVQAQSIISEEMRKSRFFDEVLQATKFDVVRNLVEELINKLTFEIDDIALGIRIRTKVTVILKDRDETV